MSTLSMAIEITAPRTSILRWSGSLLSGIRKRPEMRTALTTGRLSRKIAPHENSSSSHPPTTMPAGIPSAATAAQMPIALARSSRGKTSTKTESVDGMISAPPTPCAARAAMSWPLVSENAAARLATPKINIPTSSARRRPNRSPTVPIVSRRPANTRM